MRRAEGRVHGAEASGRVGGERSLGDWHRAALGCGACACCDRWLWARVVGGVRLGRGLAVSAGFGSQRRRGGRGSGVGWPGRRAGSRDAGARALACLTAGAAAGRGGSVCLTAGVGPGTTGAGSSPKRQGIRRRIAPMGTATRIFPVNVPSTVTKAWSRPRTIHGWHLTRAYRASDAIGAGSGPKEHPIEHTASRDESWSLRDHESSLDACAPTVRARATESGSLRAHIVCTKRPGSPPRRDSGPKCRSVSPGVPMWDTGRPGSPAAAQFGAETPAPQAITEDRPAPRTADQRMFSSLPQPRRQHQPTPELNATNNTYDAIHDHAPRTWLDGCEGGGSQAAGDVQPLTEADLVQPARPPSSSP